MVFSVVDIIFLAVIISVANLKIASQWSCVPERTSGNVDTLCTSQDNSKLAIQIELSDRRPMYLNVECLDQQLINFSDFDILKGLYLHIGHRKLVDLTSVVFKSCTLPHSLCTFIGSLNARRMETVSLEQYNITQRTCQLDEVVNIYHFKFSGNVATRVGVDFFEGLGNLLELDLSESKIKSLSLGLFKSVPKLILLDLSGNDINHLDADIFKNLSQLEILILWGNPLKTLPHAIFSGLNRLKSLDLHNCALQSLISDVFVNMTQLTEISLLKNNFSTLPKDLFKNTPLVEKLALFDNHQRLVLPSGLLANLTKLTSVLLNGNNMSVVPGDLLQGSTSVLHVRLERNALTNLPEELFKDTEELQTLDISWNQLATLPDGVFSSLIKLKVLNLSNNHLMVISQFVFKRLSNLDELRLEWNALNFIHLQAFSNDCYIKKLNLSHNYLTFNYENIFTKSGQSPIYNCTKLKTLGLGHNLITELFDDWKLYMYKLSNLDLSYNNIQRLKLGDLEFLSKKITLNLLNNKITNIDVDMANLRVDGSSKRYVNLLLKGNPIHCDCSLHNFLEYIEKPNPLNLKTDAVTCSSPKEVSGLLVSDIKSKYVVCDLTVKSTVKCPNLCACLWRPEDGAFIVNCSSLGLRKAPDYLPWNSVWKYTEVHLERNKLTALPNLSQPGYDLVTKVYAAHNNIARLEQINLSPKLQVLELNNNELTILGSQPGLAFLLNKKWVFTNITLNNNKWQCNCAARALLNFIHTHRGKVDNVTCLDGRPLMPLSPEDICSTSYDMIIALSVTLAFAGILVGILASLYYRYQREVKVWLYAQHLCLWFVTEEELDKDKEYDAFICYSHKDKEFVENYLVPGLEAGPYLFKLCLHVRDWVPGEWINTQIIRSVENSRRTVIVLTPNFLESVWGLVEFRTAHKQAMSDGSARVIILLYGDLGSLDKLDPELRGYLSMNTYIKWDDPWFWKKMHYALPHPVPITYLDKEKMIKRSLRSLKPSGADPDDKGGGISFKHNGYIPAIVDPNYKSKGYIHSTLPKIKTTDDEVMEKILT